MKDNTNSISEPMSKTKNMTVIGLVTAVICIVAPFSIPIPVSPVPISLTNFMIFIAVYILGMKSSAVCVLLENPNRIFTRDQLLIRLWGYDFEGNERVVDNHIKKLRKALAGSRCQIHTVRKSGYRMEVSV